MKFSIRTLIWALVLIALVVTIAMAFVPKAIEVETATAQQGDLKIAVHEDGKTRIREKYIVSAPVAGRINRIELKAGDAVDDSHTLIAVVLPAEPTMLDARSEAQAKARVDQAAATWNRAQVTSEQVRVNYELSKTKSERAERLIETRAISQDELDEARSSFQANTHAMRTSRFDEEIAKYELDMAKAALLQFTDNSELVGKPFEINSPVKGKVLRVFQESATVLNVGTPLIELGDPQNLEIEIDVLSSDAVRIRPGAELSIQHWGGKTPLTGVVRVVEPAAFTKISSLGVEEQRVNVIADFTEDAERLASLGDGYRVEAQITVDQFNNVLLVPNSSLFRHQREWHVFKVADGLAELTPVKIGMQNETQTHIVSGLKSGDEVILYPSDQITAGTKLKSLSN